MWVRWALKTKWWEGWCKMGDNNVEEIFKNNLSGWNYEKPCKVKEWKLWET